jgi:Holliday junction DNA helicase RuvA
MIASLTGHVQMVGADHVVIDVNGVGYLVQVSPRTAERLRPKPVSNIDLGNIPEDSRVFLFIETQVREDAITLNGFLTLQERNWFRRFTGIQGVGSKVAFSILGTIPPDELSRAITLEDKAMIARANGVGPRLAARIVTELRGKDLPGPGTELAATELAAAAAIRTAAPATPAAEAVSALENLGFRPPEALRAVAEAQRAWSQKEGGSDLPVATLIREALKRATR